MTHEGINYVDIMRSHGFRVTPQRLLILDAICEGDGHTTIGEIYARLMAMDPSIDRSTVYRALEFFELLGLVLTADIGIGEKVYEIAKPDQHHHLVCQECGKIQEIDYLAMEQICRVLERQHNFDVNMDHLVLFGICSDCRPA